MLRQAEVFELREFICKACGRKQYSTARLSERVYCGAPKESLAETDSLGPTELQEQGGAVSAIPQSFDHLEKLDVVICAAWAIKSYCEGYPHCDTEHQCSLGVLLECYSRNGVNIPTMWDIPDPESIGIICPSTFTGAGGEDNGH